MTFWLFLSASNLPGDECVVLGVCRIVPQLWDLHRGLILLIAKLKILDCKVFLIPRKHNNLETNKSRKKVSRILVFRLLYCSILILTQFNIWWSWMRITSSRKGDLKADLLFTSEIYRFTSRQYTGSTLTLYSLRMD